MLTSANAGTASDGTLTFTLNSAMSGVTITADETVLVTETSLRCCPVAATVGRRAALLPSEQPWGLRPAACAFAVGVLLALSAWFGSELVSGAGRAGLAERIVGAAHVLWLLTAALSCRSRPG